MSVQVSYKKQTAMGIFGIVILLLVIELVANVWWISQINCEFEDSEIFRDMSEDKKNQLCMDLYQIRTSGDEIINQSISLSSTYTVQDQFAETKKIENQSRENLLNRTYEEILNRLSDSTL